MTQNSELLALATKYETLAAQMRFIAGKENETREAILISDTLRSAASAYEAGERAGAEAMREKCQLIAEKHSHAVRISVTEGQDWTEETGLAALFNSQARLIAREISALPLPVSSETNVTDSSGDVFKDLDVLSETKSDGVMPSPRTAGGDPVAAAPSQAEETGVISGTRQIPQRGTPHGSGVTAGETAPILSDPAHRSAAQEWRLAPCLATDAMVEAAERRDDDEPPNDWGKSRSAPFSEIYKAMLAASPTPPAHGGADAGLPYGIIDPDYASFFTVARIVSWSYGYALALHGSFTRDLDLIAVPWTDAAAEADHVLKNIEMRTGWKRLKEEGSAHPHGRIVWTLTSQKFECNRWIDFGFMPRAIQASQEGA